MKQFWIIQDKFPGVDTFYGDWAKASIANLTAEQQAKLAKILSPVVTQETTAPVTAETINPDEIIVHGDIVEVLGQLPEKQLQDIERGIAYIMSQKKDGDLLIGQRSQQKQSWDWEKTIWNAGIREGYNLITKNKEWELKKWATNYLLLLRIHPNTTNTNEQKSANISAQLVEVPSHDTPRVSMLPNRMIFTKDLKPQEFLGYLHDKKEQISIGK